MTRRLALAFLFLAACASAPPVPPPAPPPPARPAPPALPPTEASRLDEAARLLADGRGLERAGALLAAVAPGAPRRDLLLGQLAELRGDDIAAVDAYERVLVRGDDDEVRLRRALILERQGRGDEVAGELARLRAAAAARSPEQEPRPDRKLRPLRPSSR